MGATTYSAKLLSEFPYADKAKLNRRIMIHTLIALLFPISTGIYFFGMSVVRGIVICVLSCVATEYLCNKLMKQESTLGDLTAVISGVIIALNMRPGLGIYPLLLTGIVGIGVGKMIFGGAGFNPINPALIGRLVPVAGFPGIWATSVRPTIPTLMKHAGLSYWEATQYVWVRDVTKLPFYHKIKPAFDTYTFSDQINPYYDVLSGTTYLETVKNWYKGGVMPEGMNNPTELFDYGMLFFGNMPGVMGETAKWAILLGFLYLVFTKVISPLIPISIWVFAMLFGWVFGAVRLGPAGIGPLGLFAGDPLVWLLAGGVMLGSVYMETDPVTSPNNLMGKMLYSFIFVGIVTAIRLVFSFPEGVSFGLLCVNILLPFINKLCDEKNPYASIIKRTIISSFVILIVALTVIFAYTKLSTPAYVKKIKSMTGSNLVNYDIVELNATTYLAKNNGEEMAYIFAVSGQGFGGPVDMLVAVRGDTIVDLSVVNAANETEGLGSLVLEPEFQKQFIGKTIKDLPEFEPEGDLSDWSNKGFDTLSGATYTAYAFIENIKEAFALYHANQSSLQEK